MKFLNFVVEFAFEIYIRFSTYFREILIRTRNFSRVPYLPFSVKYKISGFVQFNFGKNYSRTKNPLLNSKRIESTINSFSVSAVNCIVVYSAWPQNFFHFSGKIQISFLSAIGWLAKCETEMKSDYEIRIDEYS